MTQQRKRKSPERKKVLPTPLALRATSALGGLLLRRPGRTAGIAAFGVVFAFIAANALWYQPGHHPSPFLRTRTGLSLTAMPGLRPPTVEPDPATVTTFRIERAAPDAPEDSASSQTHASAPGDSVASIIAGQAAPVGQAQDALSAPAGDTVLLRAVQEELIRRRLYGGPVDGLPGRATTQAIAAFQQKSGLAVTGSASPQLLEALRGAGPALASSGLQDGARVVTPQPRPVMDLNSAEDPVAAAIRGAERGPIPPEPVGPRPTTPRATGPAASAQTGSGSGRPPAARDTGATVAALSVQTETAMVLAIQKGLSNIAYANVSVDGIAGEQTRAAIRHFERHYRLPETGEPNERVLKKLRDIGAL